MELKPGMLFSEYDVHLRNPTEKVYLLIKPLRQHTNSAGEHDGSPNPVIWQALVETTKEDPNGRPMLFADMSGEGSQRVELLMEAMDILQEREAEAERVRLHTEEVINSWSKRVQNA